MQVGDLSLQKDPHTWTNEWNSASCTQFWKRWV